MEKYLDGCVKMLSLGLIFFFLFSFFLYQVLIVTVQELAGSAGYCVNKTSISKTKKPMKMIKSSPKGIKYWTHCQLTANKRIYIDKKPHQFPFSNGKTIVRHRRRPK